MIAARELARALQPVSVFISRKTQHLYVRRAFEPILEIPVAIQEPERPIGTRVAGWIQKHHAASAHAESLNPSPT